MLVRVNVEQMWKAERTSRRALRFAVGRVALVVAAVLEQPVHCALDRAVATEQITSRT